MKHDLSLFTATQAAEAIRSGRMLSEALVEACLARIEKTEPSIGAWAYLDRDLALNQAREMDRIRKRGHATGVLHGVPVGARAAGHQLVNPGEHLEAAVFGDLGGLLDAATPPGRRVCLLQGGDVDFLLVQELADGGEVRQSILTGDQ